MDKNTTERPEMGTPEFEDWLREKVRKQSEELFNNDIPDELSDVGMGRISGPEKAKDLMPEKTISEDVAIDKLEKQKVSKVKK